MPYTTSGKNLMLSALGGTNPTAPVTHVGLLTKQANKAITGTASSDTFASAAHGLPNGDVVLLSGLTGGTGLLVSYPYFVVNTATNTFQLALTPGGTPVDFTSDISSGTANRLVELTGGSPAYARKPLAWNASAGGVLDDSTNGAVVDVPGGAQVDYQGYYSALTAGTLQAIAAVTQEVFAAQGTYTVTDVKMDLNN